MVYRTVRRALPPEPVAKLLPPVIDVRQAQLCTGALPIPVLQRRERHLRSRPCPRTAQRTRSHANKTGARTDLTRCSGSMPTHQGPPRSTTKLPTRLPGAPESDYTPVFTRRQARATGDFHRARVYLIARRRSPDEIRLTRGAGDQPTIGSGDPDGGQQHRRPVSQRTAGSVSAPGQRPVTDTGSHATPAATPARRRMRAWTGRARLSRNSQISGR
jgi:hypothetical protein